MKKMLKKHEIMFKLTKTYKNEIVRDNIYHFPNYYVKNSLIHYGKYIAMSAGI
jgi:hypothetical protein